MSDRRHRPYPIRLYWRLRRWAQHTPRGEMALNLIMAGILVAIAAVVLAIVAL
ncbi:MAG TPA: hypothetical protein VK816_10825 [Jatrophihabitantaceae bacterium]|nr:hypothetical protein [Jatrophihabitantaceae bacterium]